MNNTLAVERYSPGKWRMDKGEEGSRRQVEPSDGAEIRKLLWQRRKGEGIPGMFRI